VRRRRWKGETSAHQVRKKYSFTKKDGLGLGEIERGFNPQPVI